MARALIRSFGLFNIPSIKVVHKIHTTIGDRRADLNARLGVIVENAIMDTDNVSCEKEPLGKKLEQKRSRENLRLLEEYVEKSKSDCPKVNIKDRKDGGHKDETINQIALGFAFGTTDPDFPNHAYMQLKNASPHWHPEFSQNALLTALYSIRPGNELKGLLAIQIVTTHNIAMTCLGRAAIKDQPEEFVDKNIVRATKLMQLFTQQMEALNRNRNQGEQKIKVKHIHVNKGGNAFVGVQNLGNLGVEAGGSEKK